MAYWCPLPLCPGWSWLLPLSQCSLESTWHALALLTPPPLGSGYSVSYALSPGLLPSHHSSVCSHGPLHRGAPGSSELSTTSPGSLAPPPGQRLVLRARAPRIQHTRSADLLKAGRQAPPSPTSPSSNLRAQGLGRQGPASRCRRVREVAPQWSNPEHGLPAGCMGSLPASHILGFQTTPVFTPLFPHLFFNDPSGGSAVGRTLSPLRFIC